MSILHRDMLSCLIIYHCVLSTRCILWGISHEFRARKHDQGKLELTGKEQMSLWSCGNAPKVLAHLNLSSLQTVRLALRRSGEARLQTDGHWLSGLCVK